MKRKMTTLLSLLAVMLVVGFTSCQKDELVVDQKDAVVATASSEAGVAPVLYTNGNGGNVECSDLNMGYELTSGRINYVDGEFSAEFPAGFTVTTDGTSVTWSYTPVNGKCLAGVSVIVKGGNAANVYTYEAGINGDSGLVSPDNASGGPAGLSNLTFCFNLVPCEECEWVGETAWGAGPRYVNKGNWAMYTPFVANSNVDLIAGQHYEAGNIHLSAAVDGYVTITITLNDGFRLAEFEGEIIEQAVKIQGYSSKPAARNPAPGRFNTYKGTDLEITVPAFAFYGIHLDVEREVCPEIE